MGVGAWRPAAVEIDGLADQAGRGVMPAAE
jgi:hypothetical protein